MITKKEILVSVTHEQIPENILVDIRQRERKKLSFPLHEKNLKMPHPERVDQWLSSTEGNRDIG